MYGPSKHVLFLWKQCVREWHSRIRQNIVEWPEPEITCVKLFYAQLMKSFQLLMKTKMLQNIDLLSICCICLANKCYSANNCRHFNIY